MAHFAGVFPIVNTTFHEDGSLDLDSQGRLVRFLLECGAHGLGLFGTASEGYTLSTDERLQLMRVIVREVGGRLPVVVSTGHTGTDVAVMLSRQAEAEGADALMVLPPYFLKPDADGIFEYFRAISDAVRIPIMVQDAPLMTQVAMGPSLLARMARELEHVRYAKIEAPPTAPKVTDIKRAAGNDLVVFGGLNGQFLLEELGRGANGTMPGSDLTAVFARIWTLWQADRRDEARDEFTRYLPLIRYELQPGLGVSVMKHNLHEWGIIASTRVRHPTRNVDDIGRQELAALRRTVDLPGVCRSAPPRG
jgi:4-hydroxy-tetrahydrodipicolinate synthase